MENIEDEKTKLEQSILHEFDESLFITNELNEGNDMEDFSFSRSARQIKNSLSPAKRMPLKKKHSSRTIIKNDNHSF